MIRLLIADDHPLVRSALGGLFDCTADVEVVGMAANGREALALSCAHAPDVILMDVQMPELDGIAATVKLRQAGSLAAIVMVSAVADRHRVRRAMDAGACGFILKDEHPTTSCARCAPPASGQPRHAKLRH